jgi:hypothetical protein
MELKATQFRKHLFQILDLALRGEAIEINYKGSKLKLSAPQDGSKLGRAVRRSALQVDPQSIVESDSGLMSEFEAAWANEER